jgi:hypothetical protein
LGERANKERKKKMAKSRKRQRKLLQGAEEVE